VTANADKNAWGKEALCTVGGDVNSAATMEISMISSKKLKLERELPNDLAVPLSGIQRSITQPAIRHLHSYLPQHYSE
jgi:hypothetical protein